MNIDVTALVMDAIIIAIICVMMFFSARRGFVKTAIELAGYILAASLSFTVAGIAADMIYDKSIQPQVFSSVKDSIDEQTGALDVNAKLDEIWDSLPDAISSIAKISGFDKDELKKQLGTTVSSGSDAVAGKISNDILRPILVSGLKIVLSSVIFILFMFLVRMLANMLNRLINFTILKSANKFFGALFGLAKGVVVCYVLAVIVSCGLGFCNNDFLTITPEIIDKTVLFKLLFNLSVF